MHREDLRSRLEHRQIALYFSAIVTGGVTAFLVPGTASVEAAINPALALMLFVTFLQVPLAEFGRAMLNIRFLGALLIGNFVMVPVLVFALFPFLPDAPMIKLGVLLVLLTPCIDYVITFSHLGRADARLLLAATPALLIVQMVLLPVYLRLFLGTAATEIVQAGPFFQAFARLIAGPLALAALLQWWATRSASGARIADGLGLLAVPATALVLFIIVLAVVPQLGAAAEAAQQIIPIYLAFAVAAPLAGWLAARMFQLDIQAGRALMFSTGTRNSLVILPLALAVPGAMPILPAVIVTQTMLELASQLVYIRCIPRLLR